MIGTNRKKSPPTAKGFLGLERVEQTGKDGNVYVSWRGSTKLAGYGTIAFELRESSPEVLKEKKVSYWLNVSAWKRTVRRASRKK